MDPIPWPAHLKILLVYLLSMFFYFVVLVLTNHLQYCTSIVIRVKKGGRGVT